MKQLFLCLAVLGHLHQLNAQGITLIKNGHSNELVSIYFSPNETNFFSSSYVKKEGIKEMISEQYAVKQKEGVPSRYKTRVTYDTSGRDISRQFWRNGKPIHTHSSQTSFTPTGESTLSEWRGKNNVFLSRSLLTWDSVARKTSYAYQYEENEPFILRNESEYTASKRLLRSHSYSKKGKLNSRWEYTYHEQSPEELKRVEQFNGKGKRVHIREYACTTPQVVMPAKYMVQDCKRTDKDPMGNRLEIEEMQQGKKRLVITTTYNTKNKLIAVEIKDGENKIIKKGVNEYNAEGKITIARLYVKNMKIPYAEKHYEYDNGRLRKVVYFKKGRQKHSTVYRFRYMNEN